MQWIKSHEGDQQRPPNKRKQAILKTRKSLANDDDSADDFKPSKAAAKQNKKVAVPTTRRPAAATVKIEDSDGEAKTIPTAKAKRPAKTKPTAVQSDSDMEMLDESSKQDNGKGKATTKRKRFVSNVLLTHQPDPLDSDGLESESNEGVQPATKKAKAIDHQAAVTDFADKAGPGRTKPKAVSKKSSENKRPADSDLEEDSLERIPTPPRRQPAPKRTARAATKNYIEIQSDTGDEEQDDSFIISD